MKRLAAEWLVGGLPAGFSRHASATSFSWWKWVTLHLLSPACFPPPPAAESKQEE
jgi:hypothetical protein